MRTRITLLIVAILTLAAAAARAASDKIPARTDGNLIVAAYNIQFFGQSEHDLAKLAQVIQHFDVCGVLEVKSEDEVPRLAAALENLTGEDWGYVFGIRTHRPNGRYHEAYAAVWRRDRVQLGDGIVSNIWDLEEAYRNDPFMVSFRRGGFDFTMLLVHTRWSDDDEGTRDNEIAMLAEHLSWMADFVPESDWIVAGDFNYPGTNDVMKAFAENSGLEQVDLDEPSTYKSDFSGYLSAYDHIYLNRSHTTEYVDDSAHVMDVTKIVYGDKSKAHMKDSKYELSDHLPVWAIFDVSGPDDD